MCVFITLCVCYFCVCVCVCYVVCGCVLRNTPPLLCVFFPTIPGPPPTPRLRFKSIVCEQDQPCAVTCDVETLHLGPVTFYWRINDGDWRKDHDDQMTLSRPEEPETITCKLATPLRHSDASPPEYNPLYVPPPPPPLPPPGTYSNMEPHEGKRVSKVLDLVHRIGEVVTVKSELVFSNVYKDPVADTLLVVACCLVSAVQRRSHVEGMRGTFPPQVPYPGTRDLWEELGVFFIRQPTNQPRLHGAWRNLLVPRRVLPGTRSSGYFWWKRSF